MDRRAVKAGGAAVALAVFGLAMALASAGAGARVDTEASILRKHSLERLDSVANLLLWTADHSGEKGVQPVCPGVTGDEAKVLLRAIHPLMDKKLDQERRKMKAGKLPHAKFRYCAKSCHCGAYSSLLEKMGETESALYSETQKKAAGTDPATLEKCARQTKWFCESGLLSFLRKQAPNY